MGESYGLLQVDRIYSQANEKWKEHEGDETYLHRDRWDSRLILPAAPWPTISVD